MFGIPTQSDITLEDYVRNLDDKKILREVEWGIGRIGSTCLIHNHTVSALRRAKKDTSKAESIYKKGQKANWRVSRLLRPEKIYEAHLKAVQDLRKNVMIASRLLDKRTYSKRYIGDPDCVDYKNEKLWITEIGGNMKDMLLENITSMESKLMQAYIKSVGSIGKEKWHEETLADLWNVIEKYNDFNNKILSHIKTEVWIMGNDIERGLEKIVDTKLKPLKKEYEEISSLSDVYLRFDESYIEFKTPNMWSIPSKGALIDVTNDSYSLSNRVHIRDLIAELMKSKGRAVINGTGYFPSGESYIAFTLKEPPQELVNLLAKPVRVLKVKMKETILGFEGEKVIQPEKWAVKEDEWVQRYREGKLKPSVFIENYEGFDNGESTKEEVIRYVDHVVKG